MMKQGNHISCLALWFPLQLFTYDLLHEFAKTSFPGRKVHQKDKLRKLRSERTSVCVSKDGHRSFQVNCDTRESRKPANMFLHSESSSI